MSQLANVAGFMPDTSMEEGDDSCQEEKLEGAERLAQVGQEVPAFQVSAVCPDTYPDERTKDISLGDYKGKWIVLFTFPLDFTFVCPTEIVAFSDNFEKFEELNCQVIGLSVDSVYQHLAWINTERREGGIGHLKFPIIGDLGGQIARKFGFYMDEQGFDLRGTVIIDPEGVIKHISMNQPDVGRNIDEVIRLVSAYHFTAEHGVVCPASWKEGGEAIVPTVDGSKKFFQKAAEEEAAEVKPEQEEPAEVKPEQEEPAETKPEQEEPAETKPEQEQPAKVKNEEEGPKNVKDVKESLNIPLIATSVAAVVVVIIGAFLFFRRRK